VTVNLSALPRNVALAVGDRTVIPLPSYAGSGNTWSAVCVRGQNVAHVAVELDEATTVPAALVDGTAPPPPLMLVQERAVVSGIASGEALWRLVLSRPFDPSHQTAAHDLLVAVASR
jgi:hypothetical protein